MVAALTLAACGGLQAPQPVSDPVSIPIGNSSDTTPSLATGTWVSPEGTRVRFTILVPPLRPGARVPFVLALHGEANPDSVPVFYGGRTLELLFAIALKPLGAIIVAPDAPKNNWTDPVAERAILSLIGEVRRRYPVDTMRTLVTGVSMGGMGAWYFAHQHPTAFRAVVAVSSFPLIRYTPFNRAGLASAYDDMVKDANGAWTAPYRQLPVYAIHSRQDHSVLFAAESTLVSMINARGGRVQFVALDSLPHDPARVYAPALRASVPWILRQWDRP